MEGLASTSKDCPMAIFGSRPGAEMDYSKDWWTGEAKTMGSSQIQVSSHVVASAAGVIEAK